MDVISFLRQFRVGEYAVFDFVVSFLAMYLLAPLLSKGFQKIRVQISRRGWMLFTLPLSMVIHLTVGRITPLTAQFLDLRGHVIVKVVMVVLFVMGLLQTKIVRKP